MYLFHTIYEYSINFGDLLSLETFALHHVYIVVTNLIHWLLIETHCLYSYFFCQIINQIVKNH